MWKEVNILSTIQHKTYAKCNFKTLKKYLGSKYVEPALKHEMVRAVLIERQTSDCDVKCRITFMWTLKYKGGPNFYQYDQCKVNDSLLFIR